MTDKNYTKIDNDFLLHLAKLDLNASEYKVLFYLFRHSIFFKRDYTKECAASQIAKEVNLTPRQVKRALAHLVSDKYIYLDVSHSSQMGHSWYISSDKLGHMRGQVWSFSGDKNGQKDAKNVTDKDKRDNNRDKKEKREESVSRISFPCITDFMAETMSFEEQERYVLMLPEAMREKDPEEYSDDEWNIYDDWRYGNGLV